MVAAMDGPSANEDLPGVFLQQPRAGIPPSSLETNPDQVMLIAQTGEVIISSYMTNGTFPRDQAFLSATKIDSEFLADGAPYDQSEVSIPLERAADCLKEVGDAVNGPDELWRGFRTPGFFRFISGEDFYISASNGGPVMYFNFEDHVAPSSGTDNVPLDRMFKMLLSGSCRGRIHWGKFGWEKHLPCFDGVQSFPETWCDFGCAVQELDPTGKFASESNVWKWNATRGGQPVSQFSTCCTPTGFNKAECQCASSNTCSATNSAKDLN